MLPAVPTPPRDLPDLYSLEEAEGIWLDCGEGGAAPGALQDGSEAHTPSATPQPVQAPVAPDLDG